MKNKISCIMASLFFLAINFSSCGIKLRGAKKGGSNIIESYLVEKGGLQYFIKPLQFNAHKYKIILDITIRGAKDSSFNAKVNFTSPGLGTAQIDSYKIISPVCNLTVSTLQVIPVLDSKRYLSVTNNKIICGLLQSGTGFNIVTYSHGKETTYNPTKKSLKKLQMAPRYIID
jgi:hypothetical protein